MPATCAPEGAPASPATAHAIVQHLFTIPLHGLHAQIIFFHFAPCRSSQHPPPLSRTGSPPRVETLAHSNAEVILIDVFLCRRNTDSGAENAVAGTLSVQSYISRTVLYRMK